MVEFQCRQQINKINEELTEALEFEVKNRLRSTPKQENGNQDHFNVCQLLRQISELIEQLNLIGFMHNQQIQFFRQHKYKMKLPHLLSEIYEIENGANSQSALKVDAQSPINSYEQSVGNRTATPQKYSNLNQSLASLTDSNESYQILNSASKSTEQSKGLNQYQIIHLNQNDFNRLNSNGAYQSPQQQQPQNRIQQIQQPQNVIQIQQQQQQQTHHLNRNVFNQMLVQNNHAL